MICLGLDLSSKPGWAVTEDSSRLIGHGTYFDIKKDIVDKPLYHRVPEYRLLDIADSVATAVKFLILEYNPDLIFIEQSNQGAGMSAMKGQEFIHGAVLDKLRCLGQENKTHYVYSSTWRSCCGQKMTKEQKQHNKMVKEGSAKGKIRSKHVAVQWANQKFELSLLMKDEDAADAIGIACGGFANWKRLQDVAASIPDLDKVFT